MNDDFFNIVEYWYKNRAILFVERNMNIKLISNRDFFLFFFCESIISKTWYFFHISDFVSFAVNVNAVHNIRGRRTQVI